MSATVVPSISPTLIRRFPTTLCAAAVITTSLGLSAAALDIRWGAPPSHHPAFDIAWIYANAMLMLAWLILWPAIAFARKAHGRTLLLYDLAALIIAAFPTLAIAAFLSAPPLIPALHMLAFQAAIALFTLGILSASLPRKLWQSLAAALLITTAAIGPIAVYLWSEFFTTSWNGWFIAIPLITVTRAAQPALTSQPAFWLTTISYALAGTLLLALPFKPSLQIQIPMSA